jgi:hypothetical protein
MKKIISFLGIILLITSMSSYSQCCYSTSKHAAAFSDGLQCSKPQTKSEIRAYYFHSTHRCATCLAVEDICIKTIKEDFEDKIPFQSINIETDDENPLIDKYEISGQTLLIIKGDKVIDLTNEAFMNAPTHPDKLQARIKKTIELLK